MKVEGKTVNGKKWVSSQFSVGGKPVGKEETSENMILVDVFDTEPATVQAKMGMTINLGNFESLRVDVGVSLPCYKEEVSDAHAAAFRIVQQELFSRVNEAKKLI